VWQEVIKRVMFWRAPKTPPPKATITEQLQRLLTRGTVAYQDGHFAKECTLQEQLTECLAQLNAPVNYKSLPLERLLYTQVEAYLPRAELVISELGRLKRALIAMERNESPPEEYVSPGYVGMLDDWWLTTINTRLYLPHFTYDLKANLGVITTKLAKLDSSKAAYLNLKFAPLRHDLFLVMWVLMLHQHT
jgi:hypothetical protein